MNSIIGFIIMSVSMYFMLIAKDPSFMDVATKGDVMFFAGIVLIFNK